MNDDFFTKTRIKFLTRSTLLSSLLMRLDIKADDRVKTASTDGKTLYINKSWFMDINAELRLTVLAEAALHCGLGHFWRKNNRSQEKWGLACDIVLFPLLKQAGYVLPAEIKLPDDFGYLYNPEMNAEAVYDKLPDGPETPAGLSQASLFVEPAEGKATSAQEQESLAKSWENALQQAVVAAKMAGKDVGNFERALELSSPKGDWRSLLHQYTQSFSRDDYNYNRPHSRYRHLGHYLPTLRSQSIGDILIIIDTSASIDVELLSQFCSEINAVKQSVAFNEIVVLYVDCGVAGVERFKPHDTVAFHPKGGGGTSFVPGFRWAEKNDVEPGCCLYFTDLYSDDYPSEPDYPVLWITQSRDVGNTPPFGNVIDIT